MRRIKLIAFFVVAGCLAAAFPAFAAPRDNCRGDFSVLPGFGGPGGACDQIGLNSRAGTCVPGERFEILCDDASGGRYRTCQGPRRCGGGFSNRPGNAGPGWEGPALAAPRDNCRGDFSVLPGFRGPGGACAQMGLNSRAGTCVPGEPFEIFCDDASGGRYRTCEGTRRCGGRFNNRPDNAGPGWEGGWYHGRPMPPPARPEPPPPNRPADCTTWDFDANRPCPPGRINRDCRGDCESRR